MGVVRWPSLAALTTSAQRFPRSLLPLLNPHDVCCKPVKLLLGNNQLPDNCNHNLRQTARVIASLDR